MKAGAAFGLFTIVAGGCAGRALAPDEPVPLLDECTVARAADPTDCWFDVSGGDSWCGPCRRINSLGSDMLIDAPKGQDPNLPRFWIEASLDGIGPGHYTEAQFSFLRAEWFRFDQSPPSRWALCSGVNHVNGGCGGPFGPTSGSGHLTLDLADVAGASRATATMPAVEGSHGVSDVRVEVWF